MKRKGDVSAACNLAWGTLGRKTKAGRGEGVATMDPPDTQQRDNISHITMYTAGNSTVSYRHADFIHERDLGSHHPPHKTSAIEGSMQRSNGLLGPA
jgi:hypothetical protein